MLLRNTSNLVMADDPELYAGTPVCLQIIGRKLQEERMLAIAEMAYAALRPDVST